MPCGRPSVCTRVRCEVKRDSPTHGIRNFPCHCCSCWPYERSDRHHATAAMPTRMLVYEHVQLFSHCIHGWLHCRHAVAWPAVDLEHGACNDCIQNMLALASPREQGHSLVVGDWFTIPSRHAHAAKALSRRLHTCITAPKHTSSHLASAQCELIRETCTLPTGRSRTGDVTSPGPRLCATRARPTVQLLAIGTECWEWKLATSFLFFRFYLQPYFRADPTRCARVNSARSLRFGN
jgi:hypothetical protein